MNPLVYFAFLAVIALPAAWFFSEFSNHRATRIVLGVFAIASTLGVSYIIGQLHDFNYNAWYGGSIKSLIETTISEIEDGNIDRVVKVLRRLSYDYKPTYEHRANYNHLTLKAVLRMKGRDEPGDVSWEVPPFSHDTWQGHWESDGGFWMVISHGREFSVLLSGRNDDEITDVTLSEDFRKLAFKEGRQWRHELTLTNKYEAIHSWRGLADNSGWRSEAVHKLVRATPAQREFTTEDVAVRSLKDM